MISVRVAVAPLLVATVALSSCGSGSDGTPSSGASATVALPSTPVALPTFSPEQFASLLDDLQGRPVVVNIWASWCGPCIVEAPELARTARAYGDRVQFIGVDIEDRLGPARAFVRRFGWPYPSVFDPDAAIRDALGLIGQPNTVVYDAAGNEAAVISGPVTAERLRAELDEILGAT
ncbi:MAG: TlpA family protein disulfide reductase [Actinomycetota bacterium]